MRHRKAVLSSLQNSIDQMQVCTIMDIEQHGHIIHIYHDIFLEKIQHGLKLLAVFTGVVDTENTTNLSRSELKWLSYNATTLISKLIQTESENKTDYIKLQKIINEYVRSFEAWYQQTQKKMKELSRILEKKNSVSVSLSLVLEKIKQEKNL